MNIKTKNFINLLTSVNTTTNIIKLISDTFIEYIKEDISDLDDLLSIIYNSYKNTEIDFIVDNDNEEIGKKLGIIYLINDIICKIKKIDENDILENASITNKGILTSLLNLYSYISIDIYSKENSKIKEKLQNELGRITKIWIDKKIFSESQMSELRLITLNYFHEPINDIHDENFIRLIEIGDLPHYNKLYEFDRLVYNSEEPNETKEYIINSVISDQMDIYKRHCGYLNELDSMLGKINMLKY